MSLSEFTSNLEIDYKNFGFSKSIFKSYFEINRDLKII